MIRLTSGVRHTLTSTGTLPPHPFSEGPATLVPQVLPAGQPVPCTVPFAVERKWLLIENGQFRFGMSGVIHHNQTVQAVTFGVATLIPGDLRSGNTTWLPTLTADNSVFPLPSVTYAFTATWQVSVNKVNAANNVTCSVRTHLDIHQLTGSATAMTGSGGTETSWTLSPVPSGALPETGLSQRVPVTGTVTVAGIGPIMDVRQAWAEYAP